MSDTIIIEESKRAGARLVIGLAGQSGDGKTYSALLLAYGLAGCDASRVGLLDAENKRGSLYSDILPGGERFKRGDLYAPFSPQRYIDGINAFQAAGVEVLVIDSVTHEWEGPGGCEEIAISTGTAAGKKLDNWKLAKRLHKQFVNTLLLCDMHIICCIRAREKTSFKNPAKPESLGIQPICEKSFMFEMTASLLMQDKGKSQDVIKCPNALIPMLGRGNDYIGIKDGEALRAWVNGAGGDPLESLRNRLRLAASDGTEKLRDAWGKITKPERTAIGEHFLRSLQSQAVAFDKSQESQGEPEQIQPATRAEMIEAVLSNCKQGNPYGVTIDQVLTYCGGAGDLEELNDSELSDLIANWANAVAEIGKE